VNFVVLDASITRCAPRVIVEIASIDLKQKDRVQRGLVVNFMDVLLRIFD